LLRRYEESKKAEAEYIVTPLSSDRRYPHRCNETFGQLGVVVSDHDTAELVIAGRVITLHGFVLWNYFIQLIIGFEWVILW
jgi:hypothetical protein